MRKFETVAVCLLEAIFDLETVAANAQLNNNGAPRLSAPTRIRCPKSSRNWWRCGIRSAKIE
jgi:hypothetical protein